MVSFVNMFLTYLILVVISMGVIVLGVICGKKLRDTKDAKADNAGSKSKENQ